MEYRILGPLEVHTAEGPLRLGGAKQRAVLAFLLLHAGEVVSSDRLIDEIWGGRAPPTAATALQGYVSALRKLLEPGRAPGDPHRVLATRPPGYVLQLEAGQLDLARFERLRADAAAATAQGDVTAAREHLGRALALWRGSPLADLAYEPFAQGAVARLEEARLQAQEDRLDADVALGRHAEVVGELETLVEAAPHRERLQRQLMLCLYRCDRQAEALEVFATTRRRLVDELGIEPGRALRDLHAAILRHDPALDLQAAPARPAASPPRGIPFVGRQPELDALRAGLDDAGGGRGGLFLVFGEPGIGKSRLAEELLAEARERGALVLVGRCWEAGAAPAYWPWIQVLRSYVRETDPAALRAELGPHAADLAPLLPELRELVPELPEPSSLETDGARFRLFDATVELCRRVARRRPLVLLLDDLHAADAPSLLLLEFLARELPSLRVLVVGAYRDVDPVPGEPLAGFLAAVAGESARRLHLTGLSEADVDAYVALTAPEPAAARRLGGFLHRETEGNPLFVGEIVRLLAVEPGAGGGRPAIPQSIRDVIGRRLTHLSPECNWMLVLASVLGREFALDSLAGLAALTEDGLIDVLDEALAARVVADVPGAPGRARFAHVLIRDTLYERLGAARRVRLHRLALDALELQHARDPGPVLADLAHHAIAAHELERGLTYARQAAERASAHVAYEESARLYATALEALERADGPDDGVRSELLLGLGEAWARAGVSPAARSAFAAAAAVARELGLRRQLARAAAGYGGRIVWVRAGDDDRLVALLEEGIAGLDDDDVDLRVRLLARLAGALRDEPTRERRDALSGEALALARGSGDPALLVEALDGRAPAILAPDTLGEVMELGRELCEVARQVGDLERVAAGHSCRINAGTQLGDIPGVLADLDAAGRIADELRQPAQLWEVTASRAMMALAAGRLDEGEALADEALALGEAAVPTAALPIHRLHRYVLCDFRGCLEDAVPGIEELPALYPARVAFRCVAAHAHARLGREAEARAELVALAADDALPFDQEWLFGMSLLAETAALLAHCDVAGVLYERLAPWAELNVADVGEGIRGAVARYLGLLATTTASWEAADAHLAAAEAMNERMGAWPWLAYTRDDHARMLVARGRPEDGDRARALADLARRGYRELGMAPAADRRPGGGPAA